jgi:hypothetical protein
MAGRAAPAPLAGQDVSAAFYSVSGRDFFPGLVALLNSLRLAGHMQPLYVLDCGLGDRQRRRLRDHVTLVPGRADRAPSTQKLTAPLAHPATTMVLLDADMIVVRPLDELLAIAAEGRIVGFVNDSDRFFESWSELLDLGPLQRAPYLSSAALALGGDVPGRLLAAVQWRLEALDGSNTWIEGGTGPDQPLFFADQDVLNAVAMAELGPDGIVALETRLAAIPPFAGLRAEPGGGPGCSYADGTRPYLLHHYFRKPWLARMRSNVYSRLMTRLLFADDVALRLSPAELPARLRPGLGGALARTAVDVAVGGPAALRRRVRRRPEDIRAWSDRR